MAIDLQTISVARALPEDLVRWIRDHSDRFWSKVEVAGPDGCWPWIACTDKDGYGVFATGSKTKSVRAHRVSWLLGGEDPADLHVLHRCDNPPCCNRNHLFLGTNIDNTMDRTAKGRTRPGLQLHPELAARGEGNGNSLLTKEQVLEIRSRYVPRKVTLMSLANEYGVAQSTVHAVVKGLVWRHV